MKYKGLWDILGILGLMEGLAGVHFCQIFTLPAVYFGQIILVWVTDMLQLLHHRPIIVHARDTAHFCNASSI